MIPPCVPSERPHFSPGRSGSTENETRLSAPSSARTVTRPIRRGTVLVLSVLVLLAGCDTSVESIAPSDRYHYSIFGILNPAQDTQWVRVEPLAPPTTQGAPPTLNATVTLEHLASGQTWTLRDSVMEVYPGEPQHNFWTEAPIAPGASYRLAVRNAEGDTTHATTTTPNAPPSVHVGGAIYLPCSPSVPEVNTFKVRVRDVEKLAALRVRYFQTFQKSVHYTFDWYDEATKNGDQYNVTVNYLENLRTTNRRIGQPCIADSGRVIVAAGGPDWPPWAQYRDATISTVARPDSFSNVQGGHGMLSGVYTDTTKVDVRSRQ